MRLPTRRTRAVRGPACPGDAMEDGLLQAQGDRGARSRRSHRRAVGVSDRCRSRLEWRRRAQPRPRVLRGRRARSGRHPLAVARRGRGGSLRTFYRRLVEALLSPKRSSATQDEARVPPAGLLGLGRAGAARKRRLRPLAARRAPDTSWNQHLAPLATTLAILAVVGIALSRYRL